MAVADCRGGSDEALGRSDAHASARWQCRMAMLQLSLSMREVDSPGIRSHLHIVTTCDNAAGSVPQPVSQHTACHSCESSTRTCWQWHIRHMEGSDCFQATAVADLPVTMTSEVTSGILESRIGTMDRHRGSGKIIEHGQSSQILAMLEINCEIPAPTRCSTAGSGLFWRQTWIALLLR
jgi:hypothetical protein